MAIANDALDRIMIAAAASVERARAHLSELEASSFLRVAIAGLNAEPSDGDGWYCSAPWVTFLAMKWSLEQPSEPDRVGRLATQEDLHAIRNLIWEASGALSTPNHPFLFLRRLAFQQFWYQQDFDVACFGRQALLFAEWMRDTEVIRSFVDRHHIEPEAFLRVIALIVASVGLIRHDNRLVEIAPARREDLSQEHLSAAQELLKTNVDALCVLMRERREKFQTPFHVEVCEQSPLIARPFIAFEHDCQLVHPKLMFRACETALFDRLREPNPRRFMDFFGPVFERYVGEVLGELGNPVVGEADLMRRLRGHGRCVDFAVVGEDSLMLVDAKGVEGHYAGRYETDLAAITHALRTDVLAAVDQGIDTLARLPEDLRRATTYLVCVTYKQLTIGSGEVLRELTLGTGEDNHRRWAAEELPPIRMMFMSIQELEHFVSYVRSSGGGFGKTLESIAAANADPTSRRILVGQHIADRVADVEWPGIVRAAAERLLRQ